MAKIVQLITSIDLGGAENVAFNIVEHCKKQYPESFDFFIIELFSKKNTYATQKKKELTDKNIKYLSLHRGWKRTSLIFAPVRLMLYIKKSCPDIIHSHTDLPDFVLSICLRLLSIFHIKKPLIVRTIHNTQLWSDHALMGKITEKMFVNDQIVAVSKASLIAYNNLREKQSLSKSIHQCVVYNGCVIPQQAKHDFRINNGLINIAFCGRFEYQKGVDILIKIIENVNQKFGHVFLFHIVGHGTYKKEIFELSSRENNVELYDAVPGMSEKFHAFDYSIMPSRFEGLGLTSIEASLSKVPVIASYASGLDETLPDDWPLKFHLDNMDEVLAIFKRIANREYDRNRLTEKAFAYVQQYFSIEAMIEKYSKIYLDLKIASC